MAKRVGVSKDTVQRVWSARGLKPHLVKTFKLSNDPRFEEKLIDVSCPGCGDVVRPVAITADRHRLRLEQHDPVLGGTPAG